MEFGVMVYLIEKNNENYPNYLLILFIFNNLLQNNSDQKR